MPNSKFKSQNHKSQFKISAAGGFNNFAFCILHFAFKPERPAFTLLETIVAMGLVISALAGPFTLATRGIFGAKFSTSRLTALNLAQEGIELIRHMRDNNSLGDLDWRGLTGPCPATCTRLSDGSYQPDVFTQAGGTTPPLNSNSPLRYDKPSGLYSQSAGSASPFLRVVEISTVSPAQMRVISRITWTEAGVARRVELATVMTGWQ